MQFRDLKKQYEVLKDEMDKAVLDVAGSGKYINGPWVKELETELAEYVGVKHCISCANGTDALYIAMMAWDIKEGDAVFVPDFTFFSSGEVVSHAGGTPIFVDVDRKTYNIDPSSLVDAIEKVISDGKLEPKVIVSVDLFGLPANYDELQKISDKYGLKILEDGAQGFGGEINGRKACSFGDIGTTSFFPAKPLGCYGDGGAIFTDDDELAMKMQSIKVHGKGKMKYDNVRIGLNSRLDSIQAAILQVKFKAFKEYEVADVNKAAKKYDELIKEKLGDKIIIPFIPKGYLSSWAQYTIQLKDKDTRDSLQSALKEEGIPSMVYYPKPMHNQEAFEIKGEYEFNTEGTDALCDTVLSLPIHPYITEDDINTVVSAIEKNLK